MKRFISTLIALASLTAAFGQRGITKDVRQIYLWDVTLSMQGKTPGAPDIWDQVKEAIILDIQQIYDDQTEVVVIPFQHKALGEWREQANAAGKARLIAKIKEYTIPRFNFEGRMTTRTCLYEPLKYVVDNVLSSDKVDILKLLTDGIPDEHQAEYETLLRHWCQIAEQKDAYGFYIMLTSQAVAGQTVLERINPCRFGRIDIAGLHETNVSTALLSPPANIAFNVREDYGNQLTISFNCTGSILDGYKVHVCSYDNPYIRVDEVVEIQNTSTVEVSVEYLMTKEELIRTLSIEENEKVYLRSEPAKGMDQYPFAMTQVSDSPTVVEMFNKPLKTVSFHVL